MVTLEYLDNREMHRRRRADELYYNHHRCDDCGEVIKGDVFYYIRGDKLCRECFEAEIEDFILEHQRDMYRYDEV